ncbi:hypothetical protein EGW08_021468 [Elysia chlorotica]|uniref:Uncharacterized protein n=1 Tax=Elysia chlorotica TaxID=188477 RepID=A0A3S1BMW6_ELYCH|nr:hypothetical protein EGW08_021468 [Elysia chlorotica]
MAKSYDYIFKMILVGDSEADKTKLMRKFCEQGSSMPVLGVDFLIRTIDLDSCKVKLQIWDTAGSSRLRPVTTSYFRGTSGIALVYDVTDRVSFENVSQVYRRQVEEQKKEDAVVMLIGNKCHLAERRQVSFDEGRQLAEQCGFLFFETSSETGVNVEQAFVTLAKAVVEKVKAKTS